MFHGGQKAWGAKGMFMGKRPGGKRHGGQKVGGGKGRGAKDRGAKDRGAKVLEPFYPYGHYDACCVPLRFSPTDQFRYFSTISLKLFSYN